jgi:hypothetical protein
MNWFDRTWKNYGGYCVLGIIGLATAALGSIAWFINYIVSLADLATRKTATSPIELAAVTAALGGLILVGAFYRDKKDTTQDVDREHTSDLRIVGKFTVLSSACFIITFFLVEYARLITTPTLSAFDGFMIIIADVAAIIACLSISAATGLLITILKFL